MPTTTRRKTVSKPAPSHRLHLIKVAFIAVAVVIIIIALKTAFLMPNHSWTKQIGSSGGFFSLAPTPSGQPGSMGSGRGASFYGTDDMVMQVSSESATLPADRFVTNSATLELLVPRADTAVESIREVAVRFGGTVEAVDLYESPSGISGGYATIRVPDAQFSHAVQAMKDIAVRVERESATAQDVTEQKVDLEARIANLRAEEAQYLEIMDRADTVEETLMVAERLYRTRESIERYEAQIQNLTERVSMSTITAYLVAEKNVEILGIRWRPFAEAKEAVYGLLRSLASYADFMIALVIRLPIVILWLATFGLIAWFGWRLVYRVVRRIIG